MQQKDRVNMIDLKILSGIIIMTILLGSPLVLGASRCVSDTLIIDINITKNESGVLTYFTFTEEEFCPFGCEEDLGKYGADCVEPPYIITIQVIICIGLLAGFIIFLGSKR